MFSFLLFCCWCAVVGAGTLDFVDPIIGTYGWSDGVIALPPGPQTPFGLVRLSPDTCETLDCVNTVAHHNAGYFWPDNYIRIFSHTHIVGAGATEYGTIGVMPINHIPTHDDFIMYGFLSHYSHSTETAEPGYYAVTLETPNIRAELTATDFVGVHRYTFNGDASTTERVILFDTAYTIKTRKGCFDTSTTVDVENNEVYGWIWENGDLTGNDGGYTNYFIATFSAKFTTYGVWEGSTVTPLETKSTGCGAEQFNSTGAYVGFSPSDYQVEVHIGISSISVEQARINMENNIGDSKFDEIRTSTQQIWQAKLDMFEVEGGNETDLIKFYTAVYHALMSPTTFSEVGGDYIGFDKQLHTLPTGQDRFLSDLSIWDTFRAQCSLMAFLEPTIARDSVRSLILMFQQGGSLPKLPFAYCYTEGMVGNHAIVLIVDSWKRGITDFNTTAAFEAMKYAATQTQEHDTRIDVDDWISLGYIPYEVDERGATLTLDYSYDDWALGQFAEDIGELDDAAVFSQRGLNYMNIWNSEYSFFCPKTSKGEWKCPRLPDEWVNTRDNRYVEGDAWHYRFYVPYDGAGLIGLFGSNESFIEQLQIFVETSQRDPFTSTRNSYYWAGNEHNLASPFMFNYGGRPDLTQKNVRWILDHRYDTTPSGIPGNEDYGAMASWYLFGALGFYPVAGTANYFVTSPLFDKVIVHRPSGDLTIIAYDNSPSNVYISELFINGVPWEPTFFSQSDIEGTTTLEFYMSSTP